MYDQTKIEAQGMSVIMYYVVVKSLKPTNAGLSRNM